MTATAEAVKERKPEEVLEDRKSLRVWLINYQERAHQRYAQELHTKRLEGGVPEADTKDVLVVITNTDHPRYLEFAQLEFSTSGYDVKYGDGQRLAIGGSQEWGGVPDTDIVKVFKPWLTAFDGAFLEHAQPGIRKLLHSTAE